MLDYLAILMEALLKEYLFRNPQLLVKKKIGGIVGYAKSSRIYNCSNEVELISGSHVGGIAGCIDASKIFNCCNRGKLSGDDCVGE